MNWRTGVFSKFVLLWLHVAGTTWADAPKLSYFFPAGLQRGSTTQITCHGDFTWPPQVWSIGADIEVTEEKGILRVHVPLDFMGDRVWIRLYNEIGASQLLPLIVGNLPETTEKEPNNGPSSAQLLSDFAVPPGDAQVTINGVLKEKGCLLYTSPSPRDQRGSRMPSSA